MATYDDPYNPIPRRLREPTPGYSQTRLPGTERTVVETPRGGFSPDPAAGLSERDLAPENYAMPFSPTRSMRYGPGDERDLGAPVVDPRSPLAPSPARWGRVTTRRVDPPKVPEPSQLDRDLANPGSRSWGEWNWDGSGDEQILRSKRGTLFVPGPTWREDAEMFSPEWSDYRKYDVDPDLLTDESIAAARRRVDAYEAAKNARPRYVNEARTANGGYAYTVTDAPLPSDQSTPRPLFSGVAGEDFEATRRRGEQVAKLMRETDGPFANPNDWNYVRSYGPRAAAQAVASGRANISGAPPELVAQERERYLRNRTTDLSISPQLRDAARDELAQIERDAAEERRREMWAEEQAQNLRLAEGSWQSAFDVAYLNKEAQVEAAKAKAEAEAAAPPAPVSFGSGAGAIPEIGADGQPTGRYVYQAPPTPSADADRPVALGGGGMGVKDPATGEWTIKIPPKQGEKGARAVTLKPGESYYDPETKETYVAPGADRMSIESEIANLTAALGKAFEQNAIAAIERQLADARARLAALGAAAPAPGGANSPSEPQPAPAPSPTPAPAQPAASASPTGHRRWTPGA